MSTVLHYVYCTKFINNFIIHVHYLLLKRITEILLSLFLSITCI